VYFFIAAPPGSAARIALEVHGTEEGEALGDDEGAAQYDSRVSGRPAEAVPQTLSAVMACHVLPFRSRKKTVLPGSTRAAAHRASPT
jgi:hypothetical protein